MVLAGQFEQRGSIGGEVRRSVRVGDSALERGVRIDLAGRDIGIILREAGLESLERLMNFRRALEHFG